MRLTWGLGSRLPHELVSDVVLWTGFSLGLVKLSPSFDGDSRAAAQRVHSQTLSDLTVHFRAYAPDYGPWYCCRYCMPRDLFALAHAGDSASQCGSHFWAVNFSTFFVFQGLQTLLHLGLFHSYLPGGVSLGTYLLWGQKRWFSWCLLFCFMFPIHLLCLPATGCGWVGRIWKFGQEGWGRGWIPL